MRKCYYKYLGTSVINSPLFNLSLLSNNHEICLDLGHGERVERQGEGHGHHPEGGQGQEASRGRRDVGSIG